MDLKERLIQVTCTFLSCRFSISEINNIGRAAMDAKLRETATGYTFWNYSYSLQYVFVMDFCKLTEDYQPMKPHENIASLRALSKEFFKAYPNHPKLNQINGMIKTLQTTSFSKQIRTLRKKRYGHMDGLSGYTASKMVTFNFDEIDKAIEHLRMIGLIIEEIHLQVIGGSLADIDVPSDEDRTFNFIKYHTEYQEEHMRNLFPPKFSKAELIDFLKSAGIFNFREIEKGAKIKAGELTDAIANNVTMTNEATAKVISFLTKKQIVKSKNTQLTNTT
ncbi:hypothetical protein [Flavihumibacter petaseus]|uniref:HEPN AbiU2-like domain-containing protein n=1 Tax=Flavihumibacter petaseus NBRC 106054 TaxID=1220578 RepID=A0A0E9N6Q5_9BACT|nr:hypothetical protein [Flavihumibacter petaseus]GAO45376.1 hypothetical protein FPE01S_05_00730 [Flavihumibacter petaseus NBRC 106054]